MTELEAPFSRSSFQMLMFQRGTTTRKHMVNLHSLIKPFVSHWYLQVVGFLYRRGVKPMLLIFSTLASESVISLKFDWIRDGVTDLGMTLCPPTWAQERLCYASQSMLMAPDSFNRKRARFAEHPVWVTKYRDDELYAAGEFTSQSKSSSAGLETLAARGKNVQNTDLVFWYPFTLTNNPRPEDFPVMPVERISVHFKPSRFFEKNPALDVPASSQNFNRSFLHDSSNGPSKGRCGKL